jgi:hypothetical protein
MIFSSNKIKRLIKKNIEIALLFLLLIITIASTKIYNNKKLLINENYKDVINNVYFQKSFNKIFDSLIPRYKSVDHKISSGETFDKILKNYSIPSKEILQIKKRLNTDFDLFGFNWNKPSNFWQKINKNLIPYYKSYKGSVKSKAQTLSNYRFAIVYENYRTVGYVTEKIFDCLRSNCIPIYLGAPNIASILPENIYIDRTKFSTDKDLLDYISKMKEETYNKYLTNIQRFINSDEFQKHFSTEISKKIHQLLTIDLI